MCTKTRAYLMLLREYKPELIMVIGLVGCGFLYHDMQSYIENQTKVLIEINLRLSDIEKSINK